VPELTMTLNPVTVIQSASMGPVAVIQTTLIGLSNGTVIGPASSVDGNFVSFSGTTGKALKDSGYSPSSFDVSGAAATVQSNLTIHLSDVANPHEVTAAQAGAVATTGNETVAGIKTFSSSPIVPTPTTDYQVATKKYVDENGGAVSSVFQKTGDVANIADAVGYLKNDGAGNFSYDMPAGTGDVYGPANSTDGNLVQFDGITGKLIKDGGLSSASFDAAGAASAVQSNLTTHINNTSNPHSVTAAQAGAVPTSRTVNSKALSSDITLAASDVGAVATSGNETIAGIKTFSSSPLVPTPTTDYQASTKKYVDDSVSGLGDVSGPASSTDNAIVRFDSTTGKLIQNSLVTADDSGSVNIPSGQSYKIDGIALTYSDVGADASGAAATVQGNLNTHTGYTTTAHGGIVPSTRTINSKALSSDITLSASDVGADASGAASSAVSTHESTYAHGNIPSSDEKAALAGTSGTPSSSNKYVTDNDSRNSDARTPLDHDHSSNKLVQANTHESPDTDSSASSLHHTLGTGSAQAAAGNHTHSGVYEPANANIQNHISSTSNPHSVTAAQAGAVATSGDETVGGIKTFSSFPITPSSAPTTDYQAANKKYVDDNAGASGDTLAVAVASTSHGFSVNQAVAKLADGSYALAQADSIESVESVGLVSSVVDANNFVFCPIGRYTYTSHGFTGPVLYVSDTSAGDMTETGTTTEGHYLKPIAIVLDANTLLIIDRPAVEYVTPLDLSVINDNIMRNGSFRIAQRGTSTAITANNQYALDCWQWTYVGAGLVTLSQSTTVPSYTEARVSSTTSLEVSVTTADTSIASTDVYRVQQRIEGTIISPFLGGYVTLSFWLRASKVGTYCAVLADVGNSYSFVHECEITDANTWTYFSFPVTLDVSGPTFSTDNTVSLRVNFVLACGSNFQTSTLDAWTTAAAAIYGTANQVNAMDSTSNTFYVANVKLEKGQTATQFIPCDPDIDTQQCRRYFNRLANVWLRGYGSSSGISGFSMAFPKMRAAPTATKTGTWSVSNCGQPSVGTTGDNSVNIYATVTAAGNFYFSTLDATTYIDLTAEL